MATFETVFENREIRFNELFETTYKFMYPHKKLMKKIADYNGIEPFVSTLCVGLISCLRTFDITEERETYFIHLLDQYIQTLNTYDYEPRNYNTTSFLSSITSKKTPLKSIPRERIHRRITQLIDIIYSSPDTEYYAIQRGIYDVFNKDISTTKYHEEYNNYMTFIIYSFFNLFKEDTPEHRDILQSFISHFVDFHIEDDICVYDNYTIKTVYAY